MTGAPLIRFEAVHKTYDGESYAIRDLHMEVRRGEFLTFLGPSGSGKTTTLLLLAGFEAPTAGDITVGGNTITRTPPHKRNIGMVFQNYALFPHMSVADNVAFPLSVRGIGRGEARAKAERALDLVQLGGFADRRPHQLSGGQQQRAALARALVFEPLLVLMDEPFGALDKKLREQLQIEVKQLHRRLGNTMITVTHDQSEALTMADRIAVFNGGALQQLGSPEEIYRRPANLFVARFIGDANLLEVRIASRSGDECLVLAPSGETIIAQLPAGMAVGDPAILMVRPEQLAIGSGLDQCQNRCSAALRDVIFAGDHVRCILGLFGCEDWSVKASPGWSASEIAAGGMIEIGWRTADAILLPASDAQATGSP